MTDDRTNNPIEDLTRVAPERREVHLDENNPWPSLEAFTESASPFFKGRALEIEELHRRVQRRMLTVLFGVSGLGKTSLLQAGLFPLLRAGGFMPVRIRFDYSSSAREDLVEQIREALRIELEGGRYYAERGPEPKEDLWGYFHQPKLNIRDREQNDRLINTVLVFDQFEEFFTLSRGDPIAEWAQRHLLEVLAQLIDNQVPPDLKRELECHRSLVSRYDFDERDFRVLLCLREDYLPHLESICWQIPSITENRLRLLPMSEDQALEAVKEPGRKIVDPPVARQIVEFAAGESQGVGGPGATALRANREHTVSPALLSLICSRLNEERKSKGAEKVTAHQVTRSSAGILERFYDWCFQGLAHSDAVGKIIESRLLGGDNQREKIALATLVAGLREETRCPPERAKKLFEHLRDNRLIQFDMREGRTTVELTHDILTKVVANRKVQRKRRRRAQKTRRRLGTLAALLVLAIMVAQYRSRNEARKEEQISWRQRETLLREVRGMPDEERERLAAVRFDSVTTTVLWGEKGAKRQDALKELLEECADLQPKGYGIDLSTVSSIRLVDWDEDWPLVCQYSPARTNLNEFHFLHSWQSFAKFFAEKWAIPVPLRVQFKRSRTLPKHIIRLKAPDHEPIELNLLMLNLETIEDDCLITSKGLLEPAQEFLDRFRSNWTELEGVEYGGPWWVVPRWSLPVWKVSGQLATDGSGVPAFLLALELQTRPEMMLTPSAVESLLLRIAETYPHTVKEARAARGDYLPQDVAELVKLGQPLTGLPSILDTLAQYVDESSSDVAAEVREVVIQPEANLPVYLHGPWQKQPESGLAEEAKTANDQAATTEDETTTELTRLMQELRSSLKEETPIEHEKIAEPYRDVIPWLPPVEPPMRVYISKELEAAWMSGENLGLGLQERFESFRDEFVRRFGFEVPGIRFRDSSWGEELAPRAFRIEMLNQNVSNEDAQPITTLPGSALDRLFDALRFRTEGLRVHLLSTEKVYWQQFGMANAELRAWMEQTYSLTDLKLLVRAVVNPSEDEVVARWTVEDDAKIDVPPEHTLRHWEWLLGSLVFWAQAEDPLDLWEMTRHLRETQRLRLQPETAEPENEVVTDSVAQGIRALEAGRISEAEANFNQAIRTNRSAAIGSFLTAYPLTLRSNLIKHFVEVCEKPDAVYLDRIERVDLEDLIAQLEPTESPDMLRSLKLGLLVAYPEKHRQKRRALAAELMKEFGEPEDWSAADASVLALDVLEDFDPLRDTPELRENAEAFLKRAFRETNLDNKKCLDVFLKVVDLAHKTGPRNWCWRILAELVEVRNDPSGMLELHLALQLAYREPRADLVEARRLATRAEKKILADTTLPSEDQSWKFDYLQYIRAMAQSRLATFHGLDHADEAVLVLRTLLQSKAVGELAHERLTELLVAQGQYQEASEHVRTALIQWPSNSTLVLQGFWVELLTGNINAAERILDDGLQQVQIEEREDVGMLFVAAMGRLLIMTGAWEETGRRFLATEHGYVPYIGMMLYCRLAVGPGREDAREVVVSHWKNVKPSTWGIRLREGDESAWREMLIGYYLNKDEASYDKVFGPLENDASFARSDLSFVPLTRRSMLCEAYFYDALKSAAEGKTAPSRESLRKVLATNQRGYHEHRMALFLLSQENQ